MHDATCNRQHLRHKMQRTACSAVAWPRRIGQHATWTHASVRCNHATRRTLLQRRTVQERPPCCSSATCFNIVQHVATVPRVRGSGTGRRSRARVATQYNVQHAATCCNMLQHAATRGLSLPVHVPTPRGSTPHGSRSTCDRKGRPDRAHAHASWPPLSARPRSFAAELPRPSRAAPACRAQGRAPSAVPTARAGGRSCSPLRRWWPSMAQSAEEEDAAKGRCTEWKERGEKTAGGERVQIIGQGTDNRSKGTGNRNKGTDNRAQC